VEQRLQRTGPDQILAKGAHEVEHGRIPQDKAFGPERRCDACRCRIGVVRHQARPDPLQQCRAHAARSLTGINAARASMQARP
jgi:hypothetical protein